MPAPPPRAPAALPVLAGPVLAGPVLAGPVVPAEPPAWAALYVGLPFRPYGRDRQGCDCWGLVRLVLAERFGVDAPSYVGAYAGTGRADAADLARLIRGEMGPWRAVALRDAAGGIPAFGAERAGDVLLLRRLMHASHVGVVVAPGWMLHVETGIDAALERYREGAWPHQTAGIYRWEGARC